MNMRKMVLVLALIGSLLLTVGCTGKPEPTTEPNPTVPVVTNPAVTDPTTVATEPVDSLEALREKMEGTSYAFAVAYIGDTYEDEKNFTALLGEKTPDLCREYPFLLEIPAENTVDLGYGEIYCIIPADPNATVRIHQAVEVTVGEWEYAWEYTDLVYESETGGPVLLVCNRLADFSDVQVTITGEDGEIIWSPWQDKYRRLETMTNEAGESLLLDCSDYAALYTQIYQNNAQDMRLPTEEDLIGKAWGWEGIALHDTLYTTYLLAFEEDGVTIRWNDGLDEADHEIQNIAWNLNYVDDFAVLTLDLGNFDGIHSYNLLYDEEYGWLYTMVDLSSGEVTVGEEIPFRNLEPRSLNAPDPMEMVGTWKRVRTEFEGYEEEDTSGNCTIVITGETRDTLTISYTDRESSQSDYQNKALKVEQGELYWGCGNSLWLAEVDHVGPWDTTYTVTLLEDGTLLLQNYWELDGAPAVSYSEFCRAD